jgi:hypothetical protein
MAHATFPSPDLDTFCLLDRLGLSVTGQQIHDDRARTIHLAKRHPSMSSGDWGDEVSLVGESFRPAGSGRLE